MAEIKFDSAEFYQLATVPTIPYTYSLDNRDYLRCDWIVGNITESISDGKYEANPSFTELILEGEQSIVTYEEWLKFKNEFLNCEMSYDVLGDNVVLNMTTSSGPNGEERIERIEVNPAYIRIIDQESFRNAISEKFFELTDLPFSSFTKEILYGD